MIKTVMNDQIPVTSSCDVIYSIIKSRGHGVCLTLTSDDVTEFHQPVSVHHHTPGEG